MKVPEIFLPEKKLDNKVEELMKEKPLQNPQISKNEIPNYAVQENGDYLVMRGGIIMDMPDCKSITNSNFYFTIDGEEHKLHRGTKESNWLDEKRVSIEERLVSKLFDLGLVASHEPDRLIPVCNDWELEMKHITENVYKELVKLVNNA
jgi:hypothetical protein